MKPCRAAPMERHGSSTKTATCASAPQQGRRRYLSSLDPAEQAVGVLERSPEDVFIATGYRVLHFDGKDVSAVAIRGMVPFPVIECILGVGRHVWVTSRYRVWELDTTSEWKHARKPPIVLELGPNGFGSVAAAAFESGPPTTNSKVAVESGVVYSGMVEPSVSPEDDVHCVCQSGDLMCSIKCSMTRHLACSSRCTAAP